MKEKLKENQNFQNEKLKSFYDIQDEIIDFLFNGSVIETDEILQFLENSSELKDKKFIKTSYLSNKISFETQNLDGKKEKIIFNLETKKFEKEVEKRLSEAPKLLENSQNILLAMDNIFDNNKNLESFGELNEKDILKTDEFDKPGLSLKGKGLRDLQLLFRENQKKLDIIQSGFTEKEKKEFIKQQKKYIEFVAGISDKYEGGASFLLETQTNYTKIIDNIIKNSSITEVLLYISEIHQKIDSNNWQSTSVKRSYEITMNLFSEGLFERLKKENASDEDFVSFSKILTGRGNYKNGKFESENIDDELRNPELATKALNFVFTRKGGMFEKMNIKNLDSSLKNKNLSDVNKELEVELEYAFGEKIKAEYFYYSLPGYETLNQFKGKKYEDLDFENQTKLGFINRFIGSLRSKRVSGIKISQDPQNKNSLPYIIETIGKNYLKESEKNIEKIFSSSNPFDKSFWSSKKAEDFGLTGVRKEAYDLFVNMNGVGLATLSDNSVSIGKEVGKFGAIIAVSIGAAILTGGTSLVVTGAVAGASGSVASWGIYPKGYDTKKEAIVDLTSDVALGTGTGALGGAATKWAIGKYGKEVVTSAGTITKTISGKQDLFLTGADVAILGFPPEFLRTHIVDKIYHNQDLIIQSEDDDLSKIYKNLDKK